MAKQETVREPIATWWRIDNYKPEIEPLRVVAFTASFVTYLDKQFTLSGPDVFKERRERRDDIFPTFSEAQSAGVERVSKKIEGLAGELQHKLSLLGQLESLKEPQQ